MSSGVVQLVAKGVQDKYLTDNPQVSMFISNYKRHTNFAIKTSNEVIQGNARAGGTSTVRIARRGDLVAHAYIVATSSDRTTSASPSTAEWIQIIDKIEILVGGQVVDTQTSEFSKRLAVDLFAKNLSESDLGSHSINFYPLRFSFFEDFYNALPLVALQFHDVDIRITWGTNIHSYNYDLYADYICLDVDERNYFADRTHMMMFCQTQRLPPSRGIHQDLVFNHPVKFIAIPNANASDFFSTSNKVKLQINGTDMDDYKFVVPHFTSVQSNYYAPFASGNLDSYFLLSFGANTCRTQPSGSFNFSRIDSVTMHSMEPILDNVYAVNYNILKIENGMGGLLFSD